VAGILKRQGWTLARGRGKAVFEVRKAGQRVFELCLEGRGSAGASASASVEPAFRLLVQGKLSPSERAAAAELSSGLCLLLDGLRRAPEGSAQARAESHEGYEGFDLLLRVTLACNQRCLFCCVPPSRARISAESVEAELKALAPRLGPKGTLTLSGGEPLVEPRLLELLASARAKGIRRFVLQTNAVGLEQPGAVERLTKLGVRHFFVSFHSHLPGAYDRITGSRRLYPKAVRALQALFSNKGYGVTVNVVVCAWNYRALAGLMRFVAGLVRASKGRPIGSVDIYFSMINGVGLAKAPEAGVDLAKAAPFLREAVAAAEKEGLKVQPFAAEAAMPLCLLSRPARYASRRPLGQDRVSYVEDDASFDLIGRVKRMSCSECRFDSRCLGVPVEYARLFGLKALEAV
jgi:pyruvate-formate lyase-activating enzyme